MKKIVFLYSEQNFVWTSMEEIIPYIKGLWEDFCVQKQWQLTVISVDEHKPSQYRRELMVSDLIVVSCFNAPMAGWLRMIREKMYIPTPWFFYLHNQATLGLWPLYEFGIGEHITCSDYFIGTCDGDTLAMDLCFDGAKVLNHPFSKRDLGRVPKQLNCERAQDIIFVGRLSRQKNLESLIKAFAQLSAHDQTLKLHFYGKEDQLGWPNMGIRAVESYQKELELLARQCGVADKVIFHGFVLRDEIQKQWNDRPFVFCSPSLHSDENFGMAALMALEMNGRLVLSEWGGHCNYIQALPQLVQRISVTHDGMQLTTDHDELVEALAKALGEVDSKVVTTDYFSYKMAMQHLDQVFEEVPKERNGEFSVTSLGKKLLAQREKYKSENAQKVFTGQDDPLAVALFKCYGAKE